MNTGSGRVYFGGVPTEPDVKKLLERFDVEDMIPGYEIKYSEVSEVIGQPKEASRWRTVTTAWRKRLENDRGIFLGCDKEKGCFYVLSEGGKVDLSGSKLQSAATAAKRAYVVLGCVDTKKLSDDERRKHEFYSMKSGVMIAAGQLRSKKMILPET